MSAKKRDQEFAVIGLGRFGSSVARRLEALGQPVLGIDIAAQRAREIADEITETVVLDATDPDALQEVDITAFGTVIVGIQDNFETTAIITATLKSLNIPHVICQARTHRHKEILLRIGADRVLIPEEESGLELADELSTPGMLNRLVLSPDYSLVQIKLPASLADKPIQACERYEVSTILILRGNDLILTPDPQFTLEASDTLVVVGEKRRLAEFSALP